MSIWNSVSKKPEKNGWIIESRKINGKRKIIQAFKYDQETD